MSNYSPIDELNESMKAEQSEANANAELSRNLPAEEPIDGLQAEAALVKAAETLVPAEATAGEATPGEALPGVDDVQPSAGTLLLMTMLLIALLAATAACAKRLLKVRALLHGERGTAQKKLKSGKDGK